MFGIRFTMLCKNGAAFLTALLLFGCQPTSGDTLSANSESKSADSLTINDDSITMSKDYILSVKPSRYQPSLGLKGVIKPAKQSRFVTAQPIKVQSVLVKEGQWVEEGTPLLVVNRLSPDDKNKQIALDTIKSAADKEASQISTDANTDSSTAINNNLGAKEADSGLTGGDAANNNLDNLGKDGINKDGSDVDSVVSHTAKTKPVNKNGETVSAVNDKPNTSPSVPKSEPAAKPIVVRAGFSGQVNDLYVQTGQQVEADEPLLKLSDDRNLHFVATLPVAAKSQLSVGQTVNFLAQGLTEKFTGQVSKVMVNDSNELYVDVNVVNNETSRDLLKPGMTVAGRVDYGQIKVGTIVPARGIHDADLSVLQKPPYQSLTPLKGHVWIIKQNQRLTRQPIEIIKYDPSTDQYLIAGVSNDSLICLADLPAGSAGKKVDIS